MAKRNCSGSMPLSGRRKAMPHHKVLLVFILATTSLFFACGSTSAGDAVVFTTIDQGYSSGIVDDRKAAISDQAAWEAFWAEHTSRTFPPAEVPAINFDADMVIVVFSGEQVSGGYEIWVTGLAENSDNLFVTYAERVPAPDAMVTTAMSQPFHLIKTKRSAKAIRFQKE